MTSAEGTVISIMGGSITATGKNTTHSNATKTGKIKIDSSVEVNGKEFVTVATIHYDGYDEFYSCASLQAAIDHVIEDNGNGKIKLLKSVSKNVTVSAPVELDLNGCQYTGIIALTEAGAELKSSAGLQVYSAVDGMKAVYANGKYYLEEGIEDYSMIRRAPSSSTPKTGDNTNIALLASLVALSAAAFVVLSKKARFN